MWHMEHSCDLPPPLEFAAAPELVVEVEGSSPPAEAAANLRWLALWPPSAW